jgi:transposase
VNRIKFVDPVWYSHRQGKRQASKHLEELRGPEGEPLPPNTMAELRRDLARLQLIRGQIREIESARRERLI